MALPLGCLLRSPAAAPPLSFAPPAGVLSASWAFAVLGQRLPAASSPGAARSEDILARAARILATTARHWRIARAR